MNRPVLDKKQGENHTVEKCNAPKRWSLTFVRAPMNRVVH